MIVVVSGDRDWPRTQPDPIRRRLARLPLGTVLLHGDCREAVTKGRGWGGVDTHADHIGRALGFTVYPRPADWNRGPRGGPERNRAMLDEAEATGQRVLVLAFHPNLAASKGTADMVQEARRRGIPVEVITGREG